MRQSTEMVRDMRKTEHTTVCLTSDTKSKLLRHKAPGQSYNGFIIQLLQKWEGTGDGKKSSAAFDDDRYGHRER